MNFGDDGGGKPSAIDTFGTPIKDSNYHTNNTEKYGNATQSTPNSADGLPLSDDSTASWVQVQDEWQRHQSVSLAEASSTLDALSSDYLDGFNLLGVIANPRGTYGVITPSMYHHHHRSSSTSLQQQTSGEGTSASSDMFTETYHSLEMTISQVTEQLEALNAVLEDWSRQILEAESWAAASEEDQPPESLLTELPIELQQLDLQSLQAYLEMCGVAAHAFQQRLNADDSNQKAMALEASQSRNIAQEEIPGVFFQTNFDLTDPETFAELLLLKENPDSGRGPLTPPSSPGGRLALNESINTDSAEDDPDSIHSWFPLAPQDAFSGFLDKVEVALLQQVRSQSDAFFQESLRFAQLQEWIQSLLSQVVELQATTKLLNHDLMDPMEEVPMKDIQRCDLQSLVHVLEQANEMLRIKSSIGGLLSAQDDLTAIEQIQYGRRLLAGETIVSKENGELEKEQNGGKEADAVTTTDDTTSSAAAAAASALFPLKKSASTTAVVGGVELRKLAALKTVSDQLYQYEQLVVTNLREELVEIFLDWNTSSVSSMYGSSTMNGTSGLSPNSRSQVQQRASEIYGALERCRALHMTREAYSKRLQDMIRMTVRTTVGEFATDSTSSSSSNAVASISTGTTAMSLERFLDCLDMLFEQILALLTSASGVDSFCVSQTFYFIDAGVKKVEKNGIEAAPDGDEGERASPMLHVVGAAADLSSKSISELLRLRKEAHSLVTLEEMKRLWDKCITFTTQMEEAAGGAGSGSNATALRSTLLAQAKAFTERKHESNMSALVAALESERWTQCDVSQERQAALTRLCSGRSVVLSRTEANHSASVASGTIETKSPEAEVEGTKYKVVWSCLLLVEMVIANISAATHFNSLASNVVSKVAELLRLFNSRSTQLVLGAGAIHSAARLKSINAKHLSLVTQCLGMVLSIFPHVRAALSQQLPAKQQTLLTTLDQIKREYTDHNEKVLNKFVSIIGGIVEHALRAQVPGTDFDSRAKSNPITRDMASNGGKGKCCSFLEGVSSNTRKMHQVLEPLLPPEHLQDVFSRIFAFVDQKVPAMFSSMAETKSLSTVAANANATAQNRPPPKPQFVFPTTDEGKRQMLLEVELMTKNLNGLKGVFPWDFTAVNVIEKQLEFHLPSAEEEAAATAAAAAAEEAKKQEAAAGGGEELL